MEHSPDHVLVREFARKLFGLYTSGILTLLVDVGHRTGLFGAVAQGPGTSDEIARRGQLHERYVREWLAAMATGGIVDYDPASQTFTLPVERAICLTGTASRNLAPGSQALAMLARHVGGVAECFRDGGGVAYADFRPDFTEIQDSAWRLLYDNLLIKAWLPVAKGLPERLERGIRVADLGCGTGHAVNVMARAYPNSSFVGYDLDETAVAQAADEAADMGLTNAGFEVCDVTQLPTERAFELITSFDSVHDQRDPAACLRRTADSLVPGGIYFMVEPKASSDLADNLGNPFAAYIYGVSVMHCLTVSLAEGGAGLGAAWGEKNARQMLGEAGFSAIEIADARGSQNNIYICRT